MGRRNRRAQERALRCQAGKCPQPRHVRSRDGRLVKMRCKSRLCPSCGVLWAGDVRIKLLRNIEAYGGDVALVTVTAPGKDVLPWAEGQRQVERRSAMRWNQAAPGEWRDLHKKASRRATRLLRRLRRDGLAPGAAAWGIVAREWEFQRRGVLHVHVVVPMGTPWERLCSQAYADALDELRHAHGFGYVDRGKRSKARGVWRRSLEVVPQGRAARYLAKYVAGVKGDGRLAISDTVRHPDVPGHVVYVSRRLTTRTGCTMRSLRRRRYAHMLLAQEHELAEVTGDFGRLMAATDLEFDDERLIALLAAPRGP